MRGVGIKRLIVCLAIASCNGGDGEPAGWRVADGFIRDPEGRAVVMRGVNLAGTHKHAPYIGAHQPLDYQRLREVWGMDAVRFVMTWAALEPSGPGAVDHGYLDKVAERLDWAWEQKLLVVLDMHQDVYGEGFGGDGAPRWTCGEDKYEAHEPLEPWFLNYLSRPVMECFDQLYGEQRTDQLASAWQAVARRLGDHPAVIGFDLLNEPHWGTHSVASFERERLQPFYEAIIARVREIAPHWLAFAEPASSRNVGQPTSLEPFVAANVVYAPHSYNAEAESGQGFDPQYRQAVISNIEALGDEARERGLALWIGEYGGIAEHPGLLDYMDASYDGAGRVAASMMAWDYAREDGGYGMLMADGTPKELWLEAVVRPYPRRVAGSPRSYSFDEETRVFEVTIATDAAVAAPTVIAVPERVYADGRYAVECGGCREQRGAGEVLLHDLHRAGATVTVRVSPE